MPTTVAAKTMAVEYTADAALAIAIEAQRRTEGRKTAIYRTQRLEVIKGYEDGGPIPPLDVNLSAKTFVVVSWIPQ